MSCPGEQGCGQPGSRCLEHRPITPLVEEKALSLSRRSRATVQAERREGLETEGGASVNHDLH